MIGSIPSNHLTKTILFLTVAVLGNSFGNLLLALGMDRMPSFAAAGLPAYMLALLTSPYLLPGALPAPSIHWRRFRSSVGPTSAS